MLLHNVNARKEYDYNFYWVDELTPAQLYETLAQCATLTRRAKIRKGVATNWLTEHTPRARVGSGKYCKTYLDVPMGFDIETTTIWERYGKGEEVPKLLRGKIKHSFASMYCWQLSIGSTVIMGYEWGQFIGLLDQIKDLYNPTGSMRIIVFIHNMSYEMAFLRKWLNVTDAFLKDQRRFLQITHDGFFMFRDSMAMNNSSLKRLATDFCNTQKCTGDLDYTKDRSSADAKNMTPDELGYCHNDVLILSEYARVFYDMYLAQGFNPLTITATLRNEIKQLLQPIKEKAPLLQRYMPQTEIMYNWVFYWIYRGGYVHSNRYCVGEHYTADDNILGVDFTSSYPSVILYGYRPLGKFSKLHNANETKIHKWAKTHCVLMRVRLYNVRCKNGHSIESLSKCHVARGAVLDNGRIYSADVLEVSLCELDFFNYCDFYAWDLMIVLDAYVCSRAPFPSYVVKPMIKYYQAKADNKEKGLPYALEKAMVNTFYGMLCTRRNVDSITYTNNGWEQSEVKSYEEWLTSQFLSPYDGVYVSAGARRNLLKIVAKIEQNPTNYTPAIYCDTDSIKILNCDDYCKQVIADYNAEIQTKLDQVRTRYDLNHYFNDLGMFDLEYGGTANTVTDFKTLGAKRYLISYEDDEGVHNNQTIAGLPKGILFEEYDKNTAYEKFEDNLTIEYCKLTPVYCDEERAEEINGHMQHELSHVALVPSNFNLSMDEHFLAMLDALHLTQERNTERENI